jgi:hypothetical protein
MQMRRIAAGLLGVMLLTATIGWTAIQPTHGRDWLPEQRLLPRAQFRDSLVTVESVRNFRWGPGADMQSAWEPRTYDLSSVQTIWYVLTPFSRDRRGPAHAFVSFGFADGRYLAISVEARREIGEEYTVVRGMLKRFEIMYVVGDERDLIQQRVVRGDDVYVYPVRATPEQARSLFRDMLARVNELNEEPEFYGTLRNNCTTNLLDHVNSIAARPIPYSRRIMLPGYSDEVAHERGLLDTDLSLAAARERFLINDRALRHARSASFSTAIRTANQ